jgi:hypothetical protein
MDRTERQAIYNAASNMRRSVLTFGKSICRDMNKVGTRFVGEMLFGMMTAQDVKLTKIGAALGEERKLKYTVERLYRNLNGLESQESMTRNYMEKVTTKCRRDTLLLVDGGDIAKPYGTNFEGLCQILDGSTDRIEKGFPTVGVIAMTEDKLPLPVYEKIFSYEKDFVSVNDETFKALDFVEEHFSKENIRVFDRGYDSSIIINEKLLESGVRFIVRMTEKRNVIYNGKEMNILDVAKKFKGKYRLDFENQKGKKVECKVWITKIIMDGTTLNLVVCNGFGEKPMMLLTNVFDDDNAICTSIVKCYLMRWKIEEFYRFKKQTFKFEDIRVMSLTSMNNLNLLLNFLIGFLSMKSTDKEDKPIIVALINQVKRIFDPKNVLYTVCAGIFIVFAISRLSLPPTHPPPSASSAQLSFFSFMGS